MKNALKIFLLMSVLGINNLSYSQNGVGIGTTSPHSSSILEINSTSKGLLIPRMTTAQRTAIATPAAGLQVYDTTTNSYWYYNGTAWTVNSDEWIYNGTDAIEATRALANGSINSISNDGKKYHNIGYNWSTDANTTGTNIFGSDPKFKFPNVSVFTSDALSYTSPFSSSTTGPYIFDFGRLIVTNNHISNATSASKRYFGMAKNLLLSNSTNLPIADLLGLDFSVDTQAATSNITGSLYGSRFSGDHSGSGTIGTTYGVGVYSRMNATAGSITNMRGIQVQNGTNTGSTGNVSGEIRGADLIAFHNGTGIVNILKGLSVNTNLGASSTIPTTTQGISNIMNLASTTTGSSTSNLTGYNQTISNSSPTSFSTLYGFNSSLINNSTAGVPTNMIGFNNSIANNSMSTNTIAQFSGINSAQTWSGSANVTDFYGLFSNTSFSSASAGTIANFYGVRIRQVRNLGTSTVTTNNFGLFIDNVAGGSSSNFSIYSNGGNVYLKDNVGIGTNSPTEKLEVNGAIKIGSTSAATPTAGTIRFNTTTSKFEGYDGTAWVVFH